MLDHPAATEACERDSLALSDCGGVIMIESKDILALCDRFKAHLLPLDIHVLRQRYNGETFKSTYAVGREMHISDETVRTIENRALDAIAHCLDLEAAGQAITPMRLAKSFRQPVASSICDGSTDRVSASAYTAHRGELIIFASSIPMERSAFSDPLKIPLRNPETKMDYPLAAIIGRCLLVDCYRAPLPPIHTPINGISAWSNQRPFLSLFHILASQPTSTSTTRWPSSCHRGIHFHSRREVMDGRHRSHRSQSSGHKSCE
jgi:hypothetical protein